MRCAAHIAALCMAHPVALHPSTVCWSPPRTPGTSSTVADRDAVLPLRVHMRYSPHIRGKAVGLLRQYLRRHEAGGADHALVLLPSILSGGCQTEVTCSRAGRSASHGGTDSLGKAGAAAFSAFSTDVLPGVRECSRPGCREWRATVTAGVNTQALLLQLGSRHHVANNNMLPWQQAEPHLSVHRLLP